MFEQLLSKTERIALVQAYAYVAHLDHYLHEDEIYPISTLAYNLGVDPQIIIQECREPDLEKVFQPIQLEKSKRIIIEELINLGYADHNYVEEERTGLRKVAAILGIAPEMLAKIEDWVARGRAWKQEGEQLILQES